MLRDINEPFDALELTFPNGKTEFWKKDGEAVEQYYERVGYELRAEGNFKAAEICKVTILVGASAEEYEVSDPDLHRVIWEVRDITAAADKFKAKLSFAMMSGEENEKPVIVEVFFVADTAAEVMRTAATYLDERPTLKLREIIIKPVYPLGAVTTQSVYSMSEVQTPAVFVEPVKN